MSQLLSNIDSIISAFDKYAKRDGDCTALSKGELKQLIQKEFAEVIVNPYDSQTIETVFQLLDKDCDGQVDFEEFTVLVFRVARACYKKEQECQALVEGQPKKVGDAQYPLQGKRTPSRGSTRRSTQQPQITGKFPDCCTTGESQASSQEQERKPSKLETDKQSREPLQCKQEPTHQKFEKPSGSSPAQRQTEEHQQAGWDLSHKPSSVTQRTEQDCAQQLSQENQGERSSRTCIRGPLTQEEGSTQEHQSSQQSVAQESSRQPPVQKQNHTSQQKLKPQPPKQQWSTQRGTQETEQHSSWRQTQEAQRRERDVTIPKPQGSQETVQQPSCGQVQEPQMSEQRGQLIQGSLVEQTSPDLQEKKPLTLPEQCPTRQREQKSQLGKRPTRQQECEPLTQEEGPTQERWSLQQTRAQESSRRPQVREQSHTGQQVLESQAHEQCTRETEQHSRQRQTQETQRREKDVTIPKPQWSQETVQRPSCGQVQEPQMSEQRGTRLCTQESQVEQTSPDLQQEKPLTHPEQCLTHQREQKSQTGEQPTHQQECEPLTQEHSPTQEHCSSQQSTTQQASRQPHQQEREPQNPKRGSVQQLTPNPQVPEQTPTCPKEQEPLTQGRGPNRKPEEASQKPEAVSSQRPTTLGQRAEQISTRQLNYETLTEREHPTHQQGCPSQGLEKNRTGPWEQEPQSPQQARTGHQEHECSTSEPLRAAQQEHKPQTPAQGQSCHQERKPEQGHSFPEEFKPQTTNRGQSCESTETPSTQGLRESSARQGFKSSRLSSQQYQKPPQSASPWSSKQ